METSPDVDNPVRSITPDSTSSIVEPTPKESVLNCANCALVKATVLELPNTKASQFFTKAPVKAKSWNANSARKIKSPVPSPPSSTSPSFKVPTATVRTSSDHIVHAVRQVKEARHILASRNVPARPGVSANVLSL